MVRIQLASGPMIEVNHVADDRFGAANTCQLPVLWDSSLAGPGDVGHGQTDVRHLLGKGNGQVLHRKGPLQRSHVQDGC